MLYKGNAIRNAQWADLKAFWLETLSFFIAVALIGAIALSPYLRS